MTLVLSSGQPECSDLPEHTSQTVLLNTLQRMFINVRFCLGRNGHTTRNKTKGHLKLNGVTLEI